MKKSWWMLIAGIAVGVYVVPRLPFKFPGS